MSLFTPRDRMRNDRGFSLIEVLVALSVFAVVTVGVVPLLGAALRGTSLSRTETVAQTTARQMMERIQGLKWYTSWDAKQARVDLLDLFYPAATGTGYTIVNNPPGYPPLVINGASARIFTTTCPAATNPACGGITLPDGYSMVVKAAFVKPKAGTTPQAYEIVTPPSTYAYNAAGGADAPPAQLLDMNVVISWEVNGRARAFQLRSIIGEHRFAAPGAVTTTVSPSPSAAAPPGTTKVRATATNDYIYQVQTGTSSTTAGTGCPTAPCTADITGVIGNSVSTIQAGDTVTADSTVNTAKMSIVRSYQAPQVPPPSPPPDLATLNGLSRTVHAPPTVPISASCIPSPPTCTAATTFGHPDFGGLVSGGMTGTRIASIGADTTNGNPNTSVSYTYRSASCSPSSPEQWFYNPQADTAAAGFLRLDTTSPIKQVFHATDSGCNSNQEYMKASTSAVASPLTPAANRAVTASTLQDMSHLSILRVNYGSGTTSTRPYALRFTDWAASVNCSAKPGGGTATGSWTGSFTYWWDDKPNDNAVNNALIGMQVNISSSGNDTIIGRHGGANAAVTTVTTPNAVAWLKALNPLMYDGTTANDIYLFSDPATNKKGYFDNATEDKTITTSVSPDGRNVSASINGALRFDTNQLHVDRPDTAINISVGKLSCQATDNR